MLPRYFALGLLTACGLGMASPNASAKPVPTAVSRLCFHETWRLDDSHPNYLIGVPVDAIYLEEDIYILDQQMLTVWTFDKTGAFIRRIGRSGEGPGELSTPASLVDLGHGSLGILDGSPGYLHRYSTTGELQNSRKLEGSSFRTVGYDIEGSDSFFVLLYSEIDQLRDKNRRGTTSRTCIAPITRDGEMGTPFYSVSREFVYYGETKPVIEEDQYVFSGFDVVQERLYIATDRNAYRVAVIGAAGDTSRVIERDYDSRRRSSAERDSIEMLRSVSAGGCLEVKYITAQTDQDIVQLRAAKDGHLWVLTSRGAYDAPPGVFQVWDVFDLEGRFRNQVEVIVDIEPALDKIFWLDDESILLCRNWREAELAFYNTGSVSDNSADPVSMTAGIDLQVIHMEGAWQQ